MVAIANLIGLIVIDTLYFFIFDKNEYKIGEIYNQSTGFSPEPESYFLVSQAFNKIPLNHPGKFTANFIFRRCIKCGLLNIVKESVFVCGDCNAQLPSNWNCNLV